MLYGARHTGPHIAALWGHSSRITNKLPCWTTGIKGVGEVSEGLKPLCLSVHGELGLRVQLGWDGGFVICQMPNCAILTA